MNILQNKCNYTDFIITDEWIKDYKVNKWQIFGQKISKLSFNNKQVKETVPPLSLESVDAKLNLKRIKTKPWKAEIQSIQ